MCLLDFQSRINELILFFWVITVMHFNLMKNNMVALNTEHVVQIRAET